MGQCAPSLRGDEDLPYLNCLRAASCRTRIEKQGHSSLVHIWASLMEWNGGIFKKIKMGFVYIPQYSVCRT